MANRFNDIRDMLQLVFAFVKAPLFATFLLGMFWKRATGTELLPDCWLEQRRLPCIMVLHFRWERCSESKADGWGWHCVSAPDGAEFLDRDLCLDDVFLRHHLG
jgi:hypothetical protein